MLNHIYKVVWSKTKHCYVVVSELAKRNGKSNVKSTVSAQFGMSVAAVLVASVIAGGVVDANYAAGGGTADKGTGNFDTAIAIGSIPSGGLASTPAYQTGTTAKGEGTVAIGTGANAIGDRAVAIGDQANANQSKSYAIAIGGGAQAMNDFALALGMQNKASGNRSIAIGQNTQATGDRAYAIGGGSNVSGERGIGFGLSTQVSGEDAIGVGTAANSAGLGTISIGANSSAAKENSISVGRRAGVGSDATGLIAIGTDAGTNTTGLSSSDNIAIGRQAGQTVNGTNNIAVGVEAGKNLTTGSSYNIAMGQSAGQGKAGAGEMIQNISIGYQANQNVSKSHNVAIGGLSSTGDADGGVAVGFQAHATGDNSAAMGTGAKASGLDALAIGNSSKASNTYSVAIGSGANASGLFANAIGNNAQASGGHSNALGWGSQASGASTIAWGGTSKATAGNAVALGWGAQATANNALALGQGANSSIADSVALGNGSATRAATAVPNATINGITYSGFAAANPTKVVSVGTVGGERQIQNVAAGQISSTSTDAINGSQLYSVLANGTWNTTVGGNTGTTTAADKASTAIKFGDKVNFNGGTNVTIDKKVETTNGVNTVTYTINSSGGGTTPSNYFHTNPGNYAYGTNATNLDTVDGIGGARGAKAIAAGINAQALGENNIAMGLGAQTKYANTIAIGTGADAGNQSGANEAIAIGNVSVASHKRSVAIGSESKATQATSIAIGYQAHSNAEGGIAIGFKREGNPASQAAKVDGVAAIAMGDTAYASGADSISLGTKSTAHQGGDIAIGSGATSKGTAGYHTGLIAIGSGAQSSHRAAIALGTASKSGGERATAIGMESEAMNSADIAIGYQAGKNQKDMGSSNGGTGNHNYVDVNTNAFVTGTATSIGTSQNIAIGQNASNNATGSRNIAVGLNAGTSHFGEDSVTIGTNANNFKKNGAADGSTTDTVTRARNTVAVGSNAMTYGESSVAVGSGAKTSNFKYNNGANYLGANSAIAVGNGANASGNNSIAIGSSTTKTERNVAIAIGDGAQVRSDNTKGADLAKQLGNMAIGFGAIVGKDAASNNAAIGASARTIGRGNGQLAVGLNSVSTGTVSSAIGNDTKVNGDSVAAIGNNTQATGGFDNSAIGNGAISQSVNLNDSGNTAMGNGVLANGKGAVALGTGTMTFGNNSLSIGAAHKAARVTGQADSTLADGSNDTRASIIGGTNNQSIGNNNVIGDTSSNNTIIGNSIKVGATGASVAKTTKTVTTSDGNVDFDVYTPTFTGKTAVDSAVAIGNGAGVSASNTVALGKGATASVADSVALGSGSTTTAAVGVNNATVGEVTYGGFAGATPSSVVSVGSAGNERQVQNVAAGRVTATSTDAINGSQLYVVAQTLNVSTPFEYAKKNADGTTTPVVKEGDKYYTVDAQGNKTEVPATDVVINAKGDKPQEVKNIAGNLTPTYNTGDTTIVDGKPNTTGATETAPTTSAIAPTNVNTIYNNAATVGDVLNAGWNLQGNGSAVDFVKPYDTVNFVNGANTTVVAESTDGKTSTIKVNVTGLPFTYTDSNGNPVVKVGDKYYTTDANGNPTTTEVPAADLKTSAVNPSPETGKTGTTSPTVITNVTSNVPTYTANDGNKAGLINLTDTTAAPDSNVATVGDLRNMGWVVSSDKTTGTTQGAATTTAFSNQVKNANEVKFVGTGAAVVSGNVDATTGVNTITVHVDKQKAGDASPFEYVDNNGTPVTKANDGKYYPSTQVDADGNPTANATEVPDSNVVIHAKPETPKNVTNVAGNLTPTYNAGDTTIVDGKPNTTGATETAPTTSGTAPTNVNNIYNNVATVGDVLNAGWNLQGNGVAKDFVKPYDTVNFIDGTNTTAVVETAADGKSSTVTFNLAKEIAVDKVTVGEKGANGKDGVDGTIGVNGKDGSAVVINGKDGSIGLNGKDGKDGLTIKGAEGPAGVNGANGETLTRIEYQPKDKDGNPIGDPEKVATLNDGMKYYGDGIANTDVIKKKLNQQVNVVGGITDRNKLADVANVGVISDGTDNLTIRLAKDIKGIESIGKGDGKPTIKFGDTETTITGGNVNLDGNKITNLAPGTDGTDAVNKDQLDKAKTDAVNATSWKLTTGNVDGGTQSGTKTEETITNDTVTFQAGKNLDIKQDGKTITYSLQQDLTGLNSIVLNGKDGANGKDGVSITGPGGKDGTDGTDGKIGITGKDGKDAVSISGKDGVGTIGLTGPKGKDGSDGTSANIGVDYGSKGLDGNDGKDGESKTRIIYEKPDGTKEEVATLNDGLIFGGDTGTDVNRKLNTKLNIVGGITDEAKLSDNNIGIVADGTDKLTVKLAKDIKGIDSIGKGDGKPTIKFGDTETTITGGNVNLDGNKITNLAPGTDGTDAVNKDQLDQGIAAAKTTVSAGDTNVTVTPQAQADGHTNYEVKLSPTVTLGTDPDKQVTIDGTTGQIKAGDKVTIDGNKGNATIGGVTINGNNTGDIVNADGTTGKGNTITGLDNKVFNPDKITSGQAATEDQLKQVNQDLGDKISNVDNKVNNLQDEVKNLGWNTTSGAVDSGKVDPTSATTTDKVKVNNSSIVKYQAGNNLTIKQEVSQNATDTEAKDITFTYSLNKDLEGLNSIVLNGKDGATGQPGKDGVSITGPGGKDGNNGLDGKVGITGKDGKDAVSISGKDGVGMIGLTGPAGKDGTPGTNANIGVDYGSKGLDGNDGKDGESKTRIIYEKPDGTKEEVATLNDGLRFKGDDSTVIDKKLNTQLDITGGADVNNLTDNNIGVNSRNGGLHVQLAKDLTGLNSTTYNNTNGGNTVVNGGGITINPSSNIDNNGNVINPDKSVSVTDKGLNNGGNTITNVAPGVNGTDGVNVDQLKAGINSVAGEAHRAGAHAAALAALKPLQYDPLEPTQIMAGVGNYRGQTAAAVGIAHFTKEHTMFHASVSLGNHHNMVNAGVSRKFGWSPEKKAVPDRYKAGPISSVYVMQDEVTALKEENSKQKGQLQVQKDTIATQQAQLEDQQKQINELRAMMQTLLAK